jgi:LmbE family N-acetylglucosaminyl deacetylase
VMRRKYGAHTVSLFTTFGEGGQNAIGPELYEELGAIRARETMAAAEIQGSEPYFLGLKDFGYSKSADEAFRFWGHDEALRRMVLKIRELRPDVIITNHSVTNNDHGHHQATARLVLEAFDAAADSKRFPEQLRDGVGTWQVQRLFVRTGRNRNAQEQVDNTGVVTIDPNERDPVRDSTFAEQALQGLQKHATQGPWPKSMAELARLRDLPDGRLSLIRYRLTREAKGKAPLPTNSHYFLEGMQLPGQIAEALMPMITADDGLTKLIDERERVLEALLASDKRPRKLNEANVADEARLQSMEHRWYHAVAVAGRISLSLMSEDKTLNPGKTSDFLIRISNNGEKTAQPYLLGFNGIVAGVNGDVAGPLLPGRATTTRRHYQTRPNAIVSVPHARHLYDGRLFGERISATAFVMLEGATFMVPAETSIDVAPSVEIEAITPAPVVVTPKTVNRPIHFTVRLVNHRNAAFRGPLLSNGESMMVNLTANSVRDVQFTLRRGLTTKPLPVRFTIRSAGSVPATVPVAFSNARVAANVRVGYLRGFDYSLPNALAALGVEAKELSVDDVGSGDLQKYSAIIVDNRVYESLPQLIAVNHKLLDYAKLGGTLIVFYHKTNEWNPDPKRNRQQLAPYNLILDDDRITDENAPITFIEPQHPLLNFPNKLGQEDFVGWIQERGLYYPKEWDPHYTALLASNDPGEEPLRGGLLVADYGRGHYIYSSMVWYRQLRAGVPGAYRMLGNMISYGQAK